MILHIAAFMCCSLLLWCCGAWRHTSDCIEDMFFYYSTVHLIWLSSVRPHSLFMNFEDVSDFKNSHSLFSRKWHINLNCYHPEWTIWSTFLIDWSSIRLHLPELLLFILCYYLTTTVIPKHDISFNPFRPKDKKENCSTYMFHHVQMG